MPALAVTDHGNLYGAVEFLREAKEAGVKPIVGLEAYVAPNKRTERTTGGGSGNEYAFHLTLLARTGEGVRNLMRLSSKSFLEGFYYKPRIDKEILERHAEGLICLSGCASAEFSDLILHGKTAEAQRLCAWYRRSSGPRTSTSRSRTTASRSSAIAPRARWTSPGGWACRSSPPAMRTT
jgi:DNA polymerase-3 subunit alpha